MAKPRVDMDKLGIPKARAVAAVPFAKPPSPAPALGGDKSLTVKLTEADYWALREYCIQQERVTGRKVTHQQVMVAGLQALLGQSAAA